MVFFIVCVFCVGCYVCWCGGVLMSVMLVSMSVVVDMKC